MTRIEATITATTPWPDGAQYERAVKRHLAPRFREHLLDIDHYFIRVTHSGDRAAFRVRLRVITDSPFATESVETACTDVMYAAAFRSQITVENVDIHVEDRG